MSDDNWDGPIVKGVASLTPTRTSSFREEKSSPDPVAVQRSLRGLLEEMLVVGLVRVHFDGYEIVNDEYVVYNLDISVEDNKGKHRVTRRYSDFSNLQAEVGENWYVPTEFPRKRWVSGMGRWREESFVNDRLLALSTWMDSLVAMMQGQEVKDLPGALVEFIMPTTQTDVQQ